jgi:hypothetical protein
MTVVWVLLAFFALIGLWLLIAPADYIAWLTSARRWPRNPQLQKSPDVLSSVRFLGGLLLAFAAVALLAFLFEARP